MSQDIVGKEGELIRSILDKFVGNNINTRYKSFLDEITRNIINGIKEPDGTSSKVDSIEPILIEYHGKIFAGFFRLLKSYYYDIVTSMVKDESAIPSEAEKKRVVDAMIEYYEKMIRFRGVFMWRTVTAAPEEQKIIDALSNKSVTEQEKKELLNKHAADIGALTAERDAAKAIANAKNAEIQRTMDELTKAREEATRIVSENKNTLEKYAAEKAELLKNAEKFRGDLAKTAEDTKKQLADAQNEKDKARANAAAKQQELEKALGNVTKTKTALDAEISGIKAELAKAREEMEKEKAKTKGEVTEAQAKVTELESKLAQAQTLSDNALAKEKQDCNEKLTELTKQISVLQAEIESLKKQIPPPPPPEPEQPPEPVIPPNICDAVKADLENNNKLLERTRKLIETSKSLCCTIYSKINSGQKLSEQCKPPPTANASTTSSFAQNMKQEDKTKYSTELVALYEKLGKYVVPADISQNPTDVQCQEFIKFKDETLSEIQNDADRVVNLNEDLAGAVRVYVKVRGGYSLESIQNQFKNNAQSILTYITNAVKINGNDVEITCTENPLEVSTVVSKTLKQQKYKNFNGAFPMDFTNENVFTGYNNTEQPNHYQSDTIMKTKLVLTDDPTVRQPPNLYSSFKQVEQGYHICLFGYGYSGSGKTYTLLGKGSENPGLLHYGLASLNFSKLEIFSVFELYADMSITKIENTTITTQNGKQVPRQNTTTSWTGGMNPYKGIIKGKIHKLFGQAPILGKDTDKNIIIDETSDFKKIYNIQTQFQSIDSLNTLTDKITEYRKNVPSNYIIKKTINGKYISSTTIDDSALLVLNAKRIKATPNNPESSRSHLFITFKLTFKNGNTGFITIVDMAGQENPSDIKSALFSSNYRYESIIQFINTRKDNNTFSTSIQHDVLAHLLNEPELVDTRNHGNNENFKKYIYALDIIKEGFFINETLNHLRYFFQSKSGVPKTPQMQTICYSDIVCTKIEYDPLKFYVFDKSDPGETKIDPNKNCLMQPILRYLDQLKGSGGDDKPTKFIMMCAVRPDKCEDTLKSLDFAISVKSSGNDSAQTDIATVAARAVQNLSQGNHSYTRDKRVANPNWNNSISQLRNP